MVYHSDQRAPTAARAALLIGASLMASAFCGSAQAQQAAEPAVQAAAPSDGGEIIVTAQRRQQSIQEVPASIVAIGGDALAQRNITTINSLPALASNLQVTQPYGTGSPPSFTIRGISSTDYSQNVSRPIAFNIDEGIRQMPVFEAMPLYDLERVEILRGPQGALYGKNATGGAVNIVTVAPGFDTSGYISAGFGNKGRGETNGAFQTPIVEDQLAIRAAYTFIKDNGLIDQVGSPLNHDQTDMLAFRVGLRFRPSSDLDMTLRYNHYEYGGRNSPIYTSVVNFTAAGFPSLDALPGARREGLGYFQADANYFGRRDISNDGVNLLAKWDISKSLSLTSVTTYDSGRWLEHIENDGLPIDHDQATINARGAKQFVQEARLNGDFGSLKWLVGGLYSHDRIDIYQNYRFFVDPRCQECDFGITGNGQGLIQTNQFRQKRNSYSAYGRVEYEVIPDLSIIGGLRWSRDEVKYLNFTAYAGDTGNELAIQTIAPSNYYKAFSNLSGEGGITYKASRDVNLYATFKQGYRTGTFNSQAFTDPSEITAVKPEKASNWEIGAKTNLFDRLVTFNVAGFYTIYHNQQIISAEGLLYPLRGIDRSRLIGAEVDLTIRPTSTLSVNGGVGYTDGVYTDGEVSGIDISGNQMSSMAKWTVNFGVDWTAYQNDDVSLKLHLDGSYQSRTYFDVLNTPFISDDGHTVFNGQIVLTRGDWRVELWGANLFNEKYIAYMLDATAGFGFTSGQRGSPRTYGLRLRRQF